MVPNNTYDFVVEFNKEKAFTRINTDTLKDVSIATEEVLEYYYDTKYRKALTDTIPFILGTDHRVYLKGKINNSETLNLLFDTGANAIVVVSKLIGNKVNLRLDGKVENQGSDGIETISTSSSNRLKVNNLSWDKVKLLSIDYQSPHFDGVLGWITFENKFIEIDYEKKILIAHKSKETIPKDFIKIETKMIRGIPYIKGEIKIKNKKTTGWFEYDSGSNGSLSLSQKFASENNLNGIPKTVGSSISLGSTGIKWKENDYIFPKLILGGLEIKDIPVSIREKDPKGVEHNDILGNNLLKRFNTIIDLQNFEIYLKPNRLISTEY